MAYHVALALTAEQVKRLKQLALTQDLSVKDLVTGLVTRELNNQPAKVGDSPNSPNSPSKKQ